ncbi:MAG: hypothetical protein JXR79_02230 [Nitrospirae bacterium]|nr:hypothetical protein [Nitrospirota bacterium]
MRKINFTLALLVLFFVVMIVGVDGGLSAATYTSAWNDFTVTVPDGWRVSLDNEGTGYANSVFKSPEPNYSLSIRWYTHWATHMQTNGSLEMFASADDFAKQISAWYGNSYMVEQVHEINVGDKKMKRFTGKLSSLSQKDYDAANYSMNRRSRMGGILFSDSEAIAGGRQVWTVVPARSGFYVLAYFAPDVDYGKYEKYYNQMIASFVPKDGPGGTGSKADPNLSQKIEQDKLEGLIAGIRSQKDTLFKQGTKSITDYAYSSSPRNMSVPSGRFAGSSSLEDIIKFVSNMKAAPVIPEAAKRSFVKANIFMKAAKAASDFKEAVVAYQEALFDAPWWGDAYYNMGIAFAGAEQPVEAKESLNLYLLTNPKEPDKSQALNKIYEIEAKQELQNKREAAMKAKYGGNRGGSYGVDDLYRYGAVVQKMSFDASGMERTISLKIVTRKEAGYLRSYFQITDLTSSYDVYLQILSIDWRGTKTFYFDDRAYPNKQLMTMTVTSYGDGDANITIRPANNSSAGIKTTLNALLKELATQAVYAGDRMSIGGREFYALAQGGSKGSLLFFPPEIKGILENGSVRDLMPKLVAIVNYRASDGTNARYYNSDLGEINGKRYHLEFDGSYYVAKEGRGENH